MLSFKEKNYENFGKCLEISNGKVDLLVTLDIGPRIIRYGFCGGANVMYNDIERINGYDKADLKDMFGEKAHWYLYGGHRLWISPEYTETYFPDNNPVSYEICTNRVVFSCDVQEITGLLFRTAVTLNDESADVKIEHTIENLSGEPFAFAPWALTVLDKGGIELIPQNDDNTELLPNRTMMIWPYTDFTDGRIFLGKKYVTLKQDSNLGPTKLGFDLKKSLAAYINKGVMFVKYYNHYENGVYPDNGCSFETYTNKYFLECETLGEYGVKPDGSITKHVEYWSLFDNVKIDDPRSEKEIDTIFEKYGI